MSLLVVERAKVSFKGEEYPTKAKSLYQSRAKQGNFSQSCRAENRAIFE
ncbi:MAG: hypothetical protein RR993_01080 [Clostridia bacterium]